MIPPEIARPAQDAGLEAAAVMAVVEVESGGRWLHRNGPKSLPVLGALPGDLPYILFEPHVFWRNLPSEGKRRVAAAQGLAYPRWGEQPYPKGQAARWEQLARALSIDSEAACRACSWGVGQVLGENAPDLDYGTAVAMARVVIEGGVQAQVEAMLRFIQTKPGCRQALAARDWTTFARLYNGPGHARHDYAGRMERAYRELTGQTSPVVLRIGDRGADVRRLQQALDAAGHYDGPVDGAFGPGTEAAVRRFQEANRLAVDGVVGARTWQRLAKDAPEPPTPQPVDTPAADLTAQAGKITAGAGVAIAAGKQVGEALDVTADVLAKLPPWAPQVLVLALVAGGLLWLAGRLWRRWA